MHLMLVKDSEPWRCLPPSEENIGSHALHSPLLYNKRYPRDFPGGPEVMTLCIQHRD